MLNTRWIAWLGDLAAPNRRAFRGEMDGMSISGHPGQDKVRPQSGREGSLGCALYGRPRQEGTQVREARRAAKPGTQPGKLPGVCPTSLTNVDTKRLKFTSGLLTRLITL